MAFATNPLGTLAPGAGITYYWHNSGYTDMGVLILQPHPLNPGGILLVVGTRKENVPGVGIRYAVSFKNIGNVSTNWSLEGGGVV